MLEALSPFDLDRADAAATAIHDYLADLAASRRAAQADDLISALNAVTDNHGSDNAGTGGNQGRLTESELVTMAALLLAAGFETTTLLLANGLLALLRHPDQAARLRAEPGLAVRYSTMSSTQLYFQ